MRNSPSKTSLSWPRRLLQNEIGFGGVGLNIVLFRLFFRTYVDLSVQKRPVLDVREYVYERTLNSAFSLTDVWRKLVATADYEVIKNQRRKNTTQADVWRLRWISKKEGSRESPAYLIVKWIFTELAVEIGLNTNPTYRKIAMTGTDVGVIFQTLWSKADDILYQPNTRLFFYAIILLSATSGFRPGTLLNLTFSQFQVAIVRDPTDPARTQIVVSISIEKNKVKETAKTSRARNGGSIGFSITLIPNCTFCLGSLTLTRGVQCNAFDADFATVDQIFDQPNLEHVDLVPLPWKTDMLKKKIFPMSYKTLNDLWHRMLLVSGTGANLNSVLSDALRNYVLSYTTYVFESTFKANIRDHSQLFTKLCNVSLGRDTNAPVDISPKEELQFENRPGIIELRNAIKITTDSKHRAGLRLKLKGLIKTLS
ncbi:hypothetical protein F5Y16DRAFT_413825 [Xylariaceae sp. FL0255]|nr:hypothetical protein F5Y16DRAFT_413825 [Xylariaceae sp. FL0255]